MKKLGIAKALLNLPSCIIMDEPLSGLDSASALIVMKTLRLMSLNGHSILLSVHQPSIEIMNMADNLWLLMQGTTPQCFFSNFSQGEEIYCGPVKQFTNYMQKMEVVNLPPGESSPGAYLETFFEDVAALTHNKKALAAKLSAIWKDRYFYGIKFLFFIFY